MIVRSNFKVATNEAVKTLIQWPKQAFFSVAPLGLMTIIPETSRFAQFMKGLMPHKHMQWFGGAMNQMVGDTLEILLCKDTLHYFWAKGNANACRGVIKMAVENGIAACVTYTVAKSCEAAQLSGSVFQDSVAKNVLGNTIFQMTRMVVKFGTDYLIAPPLEEKPEPSALNLIKKHFITPGVVIASGGGVQTFFIEIALQDQITRRHFTPHWMAPVLMTGIALYDQAADSLTRKLALDTGVPEISCKFDASYRMLEGEDPSSQAPCEIVIREDDAQNNVKAFWVSLGYTVQMIVGAVCVSVPFSTETPTWEPPVAGMGMWMMKESSVGLAKVFSCKKRLFDFFSKKKPDEHVEEVKIESQPVEQPPRKGSVEDDMRKILNLKHDGSRLDSRPGSRISEYDDDEGAAVVDQSPKVYIEDIDSRTASRVPSRAGEKKEDRQRTTSILATSLGLLMDGVRSLSRNHRVVSTARSQTPDSEMMTFGSQHNTQYGAVVTFKN